jgi:glycosyltransferase involved in cell wall biosynthesis
MPRTNKEPQILAWPGLNFTESNLYNHQLYTSLKRLGVQVTDFDIRNFFFSDYQVWHLHWPEIFLSDTSWVRAFIKTAALFVLMGIAKLRGKKIVWTVHNLAAHEHYHKTLERVYWKYFPGAIDGYICLAESSQRSAIQKYPALNNKMGCVIPHGHYRVSYQAETDREACKQKLGLNPGLKTLLYFGSIREYKNVPALLVEFKKLPRERYQLVVAGKPNTERLKQEILGLAGEKKDVFLFPEHIEHAEIASFFCAADLVVLPYSEILNSGVALLALSLNRPVLGPCLGAFPELSDRVGQQWVHTYAGEFRAEYIEQALGDLPAGHECVDLSFYDWDKIARATRAFLLSLTHGH